MSGAIVIDLQRQLMTLAHETGLRPIMIGAAVLGAAIWMAEEGDAVMSGGMDVAHEVVRSALERIAIPVIPVGRQSVLVRAYGLSPTALSLPMLSKTEESPRVAAVKADFKKRVTEVCGLQKLGSDLKPLDMSAIERGVDFFLKIGRLPDCLSLENIRPNVCFGFERLGKEELEDLRDSMESLPSREMSFRFYIDIGYALYRKGYYVFNILNLMDMVDLLVKDILLLENNLIRLCK